MDQPSKELAKTLWIFFIVHAVLFVFVNGIFMLLNLAMRTGGLWFITPLFFWSLLLALHYYVNRLILSGFFIRLQNKILDKLDR